MRMLMVDRALGAFMFAAVSLNGGKDSRGQVFVEHFEALMRVLRLKTSRSRLGMGVDIEERACYWRVCILIRCQFFSLRWFDTPSQKDCDSWSNEDKASEIMIFRCLIPLSWVLLWFVLSGARGKPRRSGGG